MLAFLILSSLVGVGLSMGGSDDDTFESTGTSEDGSIDHSSYPEWDSRDEDETDLLGTLDGDVLVGGQVDGEITGDEGSDIINGLDGDDTLTGGSGDDMIFGGRGDDLVTGGPGDDALILGSGNDIVDSEIGTDDMDGDDTIYGESGDDMIADVSGSNYITGDDGDDLLIGLDGLDASGTFGTEAERGTADILDGGQGDDTLSGDDGDQMTGDGENDFFIVGTHLDSGGYVPAPVEVLDFNVEEDVFLVSFLDAPDVEPDVTYEHEPENDYVVATVNGTVVAHLRGLEEADIELINTAITS